MGDPVPESYLYKEERIVLRVLPSKVVWLVAFDQSGKTEANIIVQNFSWSLHNCELKVDPVEGRECHVLEVEGRAMAALRKHAERLD